MVTDPCLPVCIADGHNVTRTRFAPRLQRERLKASTFEGMFQEASAATAIFQEQAEQHRADAHRIAQEVGDAPMHGVGTRNALHFGSLELAKSNA